MDLFATLNGGDSDIDNETGNPVVFFTVLIRSAGNARAFRFVPVVLPGWNLTLQNKRNAFNTQVRDYLVNQGVSVPQTWRNVEVLGV